MEEGLPFRAWHIKLRQDGICNLCDEGLETLEHGLMQCASIQEAWNNFRDLKIYNFLMLGFNSQENICWGSFINSSMNNKMKKLNGTMESRFYEDSLGHF